MLPPRSDRRVVSHVINFLGPAANAKSTPNPRRQRLSGHRSIAMCAPASAATARRACLEMTAGSTTGRKKAGRIWPAGKHRPHPGGGTVATERPWSGYTLWRRAGLHHIFTRHTEHANASVVTLTKNTDNQDYSHCIGYLPNQRRSGFCRRPTENWADFMASDNHNADAIFDKLTVRFFVT
jgi:hypothetical protein